MLVEKWICNKCGSPCRVEIEFDGKGPAGDADRFRKACISGNDLGPEDRAPEWISVFKGKVENEPSMEEKYLICQCYSSGADCAWQGDSIQCGVEPCRHDIESRRI